MFDSKFQTIINLHIARYKVLKTSKQYEDAMKELELVIAMMSKAILIIFGKQDTILPKVEPKLLQGIKNITLEDVINPNNTITINKDGFLRIKT